jgi:hypothetical protein
MKQTLDLNPTADPLGFSPWFAGAPAMITGTVPTYPDMTTWMAQLWKYQSDAYEADAEPLLTAVGAEAAASGTMTVTFTAAQLSSLTFSTQAGSNNYWLTIGGVDINNLPAVVRFGTIEIIPSRVVTEAGASISGITIEDDVASFVFNGVTYSLPVEEIPTPPGAVEGAYVVIDDVLVLTVDGVSYSAAVTPAT